MSKDVNAARPDVSLGNRIRSMFQDDPDTVSITYNQASEDQVAKIIIKVKDMIKAAAIRKILPKRYDISLPLDVEVIDASEMDGLTIEKAFEGNPHFKQYLEIKNPLMSDPFHVCIFNEEVIKFKNDNGGSLHGYEFRLMEDLAREVAPITGLFYTTDDGIPIIPPNEDSTGLTVETPRVMKSKKK